MTAHIIHTAPGINASEVVDQLTTLIKGEVGFLCLPSTMIVKAEGIREGGPVIRQQNSTCHHINITFDRCAIQTALLRGPPRLDW